MSNTATKRLKTLLKRASENTQRRVMELATYNGVDLLTMADRIASDPAYPVTPSSTDIARHGIQMARVRAFERATALKYERAATAPVPA